MNTYEQLTKEYERLCTQAASLENAINALPDGTLLVNKNGKGFRHYNIIEGKRYYLSSKNDWPIIEALAKKKYLQKMLVDINNEQKAIEKYLRVHDETDHAKEMLLKYPYMGKILAPLFNPLDKKLTVWANAPYPSSAGHPEQLIHPGPEGKMYRSKSEAMIGYLLYKNKLPNRYEWDKTISGVTYHIDFTIRHPVTGATVYWEHCGLMDKDGYAANIGTKIRDFESVGIFPERNLILTYESKKFPFEIGMAEEIIERWFL